jgi:pyroglutamyl-peptidase
MLMKALVTGFEPFGGDTINPALEAIGLLKSRLGPLQIETRRIPTVFGAAIEAIEAAIDEVAPDIVLAVGQAGGRTELSLERVAINVDDARIADNAGQQPIDRPIVAGGPAAYFATLPIKAAVQAMRNAGLPAAVSNTAGTFVCNHIFYGLMHGLARRGGGMRGGFLHIPFLPVQAARQRAAASMALEHIVQGIEIIIAVTASRQTDLLLAEGEIS